MEYSEEIHDWQSFHDHFHLRADTVTLYTRKVQDICCDALNASNIRHPPITSRIKSWESAKGSVNRRNRERIIRRRIRDLVESRGRRWEDYIHDTGFGLYGKETKPFNGPEEMFSALHDFGGVRISLYFPGDIEKVASILNDQFNILRRIEKGHGSQSSIQSLEERLELLQDPEKSTKATIDASVLQRSMRTFTGYKATHFVVKLHDYHIQEHQKHAWKDIVVEIQVGTLVMHVWSEIEHDMIYKQLDSQNAEVSEDEKRILDLINGIVLTGEAALRQLEASTAQRLKKRAEDENSIASSHYELATWIEKYISDKYANRSRGFFTGQRSEWSHLEQLFTILKLTDSHKHSEVTRLMKNSIGRIQLSVYRLLLPMKMLGILANEAASSDWPKYKTGTSDSDLAENARLSALHLVYSMNIAIYLEVAEEFLSVRTTVPRPPIASILDILHPGQPKYSSRETLEIIINYCKGVVSPEHRTPKTSNELVEVAMNLPVTHLVGGSAEGVSHKIAIPAMIIRLFPITEHTNGANKIDTDRVYRILDLFDIQLSSPLSSFVIWDRVREQPVDLTGKQLIRNRFFVPNILPEDHSFGQWKLVDQIMNIKKMHPEDINKSVKPRKSRRTSPNSVLELAYRLHPAQEWGRLDGVENY